MTIEKKIKVILEMGVGRTNLADEKAVITAALKKKIPKKPNYEHCTEMYACCPSCGLFLSRKAKHLYCPECGQGIDWEEGAEE